MIKDNAQNVHLAFPCRHCRREISGTLHFFPPWVWLVPFAIISYETSFQSCYKMCICRKHIWFMQDGAPSHFLLAVGELLKVFLWQWTEWAGPTAWPVHSPDLNPFHFYLWWHQKPTICATEVSDVQDLQTQGRVDLWWYVRHQEFSSESGNNS
jgi:hypothetical protein